MELKKLYVKLFEIQQALQVIKKGETASVPTKKGGVFDYQYFDINALIEHIKPHLEKQKLVLIQPLSYVGDKGAIRTILIDTETGEKIEDVTPLTYNEDPQKMGSAITYYRRYAIQSLFFLQAEDDDGAGASGKTPKLLPRSATAAPTVKSDGEYFYNTGISKKNNKPYWNKKHKQTGEITWLTEQEYAEQANGGNLPPFTPGEAEQMQGVSEFEEWANSPQF